MDEDEIPNPDELFEHDVYRCAHCGQPNQIFVDTSSTFMFLPGGIRQQQAMEECEFCCGSNLVLVQLNLDGATRIRAERAEEI